MKILDLLLIVQYQLLAVHYDYHYCIDGNERKSRYGREIVLHHYRWVRWVPMSVFARVDV